MLEKLQELKERLNGAIAARSVAVAELKGLVKKEYELENAIKMKEAQSIMSIPSDGKNQYVTMNGVTITLSNDKLRDSYRRLTSQELRNEQAVVRGSVVACREQIGQCMAEIQSCSILMDAFKVEHELTQIVTAAGRM